MLERHASASASPFDEEGLYERSYTHFWSRWTERWRLNRTNRIPERFLHDGHAWGTPLMITKLTIAKVDALLTSGESLAEIESWYWEGKTTDDEDRILIALCFMIKESYKSESTLPSAISMLRHVIKRMAMTESPQVMEAFVLAVGSFNQKEYAAQGDSTRTSSYKYITVPDSLRGQLVACMEELFSLAQNLSSNILLGIYVLQLSALVSHVHRISPRLASTAVPSEAERTVYLVALDKAVQEYASSRTGDSADAAFSQEVVEVLKKIEAGGVSMAQKRVIGRARAYVQTG
ncbi:hypothetical protein B0H17DRAFT_1205522 [Mycena rosella]|uniref:Uncharacterized protein n=1 Tax=Mycena rosella TaxID=1033263 RepID=A0AAD7D6Z5_MYCRO|nr:hypothetical protein B0H17DRAFT_1205522 [Mycena rosella]